MKIVVIGGTGLIGSKVIAILRQGGHEAIAASPKSGVNTITGEGVKEALAGVDVVVDLANSPSFEDKAVLEFFETSGRNLLPAERAAGVRHHVALSIVGVDRSADIGYFRAKLAQEKLIEASGVPYTIIRATQFMEFLGGIADFGARDKVKMSPGLFQPIAADDVAAAVAEAALAARATGSSRSRARIGRRSTRSSPAISKRPATRARSCATRGALFRRPRRGALACPDRRGAPRPDQPRRMAAPQADGGVIAVAARRGYAPLRPSSPPRARASPPDSPRTSARTPASRSRRACCRRRSCAPSASSPRSRNALPAAARCRAARRRKR